MVTLALFHTMTTFLPCRQTSIVCAIISISSYILHCVGVDLHSLLPSVGLPHFGKYSLGIQMVMYSR